jgi:hypothetical protein
VLFEELFQSGFLWNLIARNLVIVLWKRWVNVSIVICHKISADFLRFLVKKWRKVGEKIPFDFLMFGVMIQVDQVEKLRNIWVLWWDTLFVMARVQISIGKWKNFKRFYLFFYYSPKNSNNRSAVNRPNSNFPHKICRSIKPEKITETWQQKFLFWWIIIICFGWWI